MRKLYWNIEAFRSTCNFDHIKTHYYWSHPHVRRVLLLSFRSGGFGLFDGSLKFLFLFLW